jgi:type II secretory pathway component PulJ
MTRYDRTPINRPRRGFTVLLAIALLAFVSVALVALSHALLADIRRTGNEQADAQLRQLLRAGETLAKNHGPASRDLPTRLSVDDDLFVELTPVTDTDGRPHLRLTAHADGRRRTKDIPLNP